MLLQYLPESFHIPPLTDSFMSDDSFHDAQSSFSPSSSFYGSDLAPSAARQRSFDSPDSDAPPLPLQYAFRANCKALEFILIHQREPSVAQERGPDALPMDLPHLSVRLDEIVATAETVPCRPHESEASVKLVSLIVAERSMFRAACKAFEGVMERLPDRVGMGRDAGGQWLEPSRSIHLRLA